MIDRHLVTPNSVSRWDSVMEDFVNSIGRFRMTECKMNGPHEAFEASGFFHPNCRCQPNANGAFDPIKKVIFNNPATIVIWKDGSKTVVKCGPNDSFDPEKGLAIAIAKKFLGNRGNYNNIFKKHLKKGEMK